MEVGRERHMSVRRVQDVTHEALVGEVGTAMCTMPRNSG